MRVLVLKTLGGEEVISEVSGETELTLVIDRPRTFQITNNGGQYGAELFPFFLSDPDKKNITVNKNSLVAYFDASLDLTNSYLKATTGILLG
jgi:hypothetical protein